MIETVPIPLWVQRQRDITSFLTCEGKWPEDWKPLNRPGLTVTMDGESFVRDENAPYLGNKIDALPYYSHKITASVPVWEAKCLQKQAACDRYEYKGDGRVFTGIIPNDFVVSSSTFTKEEKEFCKRIAILKAKAALRKADASIPMMLKERAETLKMMKSYAGRGLDLIRRRQLKDVARWKRLKGRPGEQKKLIAQGIANEHLMFIFGLLPLLEDLEGLAKHLMRDEHKFVKGKGRQTKKVDETSVHVGGYGFTTVKKREIVYSVRCDMRADIEFQILGRAQELGFSPLYTLFDFTPLSFVTGWFSNFNHWVRALDPLYGSKYRTGSISIREQVVVNRETHGWETPLYKPKGKGSSFGISTINTRIPVPSEPPLGDLEFMNNFSFFSVAASVSLFVQRKVKLTQRAIGMKPFRYRSKKPAYLPPLKYTRPNNG